MITEQNKTPIATRVTDDNKADLTHFLKLAAAQVRHRMKLVEASPQTEVRESKTRMLQLLEDLINEQEQSNENSRSSARATR